MVELVVFVGSRERCIEGWGNGVFKAGRGVLKAGGVVYSRLGSGVLKAGGRP